MTARMPQNKKNGTITRSERTSANSLVETMLADHKSKIGDVVYVVIDDRTMIELPAHLSPEEREARIENYKKLHNSRI